ncbi:MAG: YidB family protein [Xanthobacteraceae bacterium]
MGLLDVLNGMQIGPRGQQGTNTGSGGMSPIMMAVLGLVAYKALKSFTGQPGADRAAPNSPGAPGNTRAGSGGLDDLLKGGLGGLLGGGAAGSVLSGGLNDLLKQFQQGGHADSANSWVGAGPNKTIAPNDLANALGSDKINALMTQSGMSRDDLLQGLSQYLPQVVDHLTPEGRLPTEEEAARLI